MKKLLFVPVLMLLNLSFIYSQNVGIGTNSPDPSAALEIEATNQGLLIPRTDTASVANPVVGLMIFQTSDNGFYFHTGSNWKLLGTVPEISDTDNDTKIVLEQSPDDDVIRFLVEGIEYMSLSNKSLLLEYPGYSTFIGRFAGQNDDGTNNSNVFIGRSAGGGNTSGANNMFIGNYSGMLNTSGSFNVNIGLSAGNQKNSNYNTNIGAAAGQAAGGGNNTNIGYQAGRFNTGYSNTMIGFGSGYSNRGYGNVFLGFNAGRSLLGNNLLAISNSDDSTPLINGKFDTDEVIINGSTEIVNKDLIFSDLGFSDSDVGIKFKESNFSFMGITYEGDNGYDKKIHFKNYDQGVETKAMTIDYNGQVGIGQENPTHKLEVLGSTKLEGEVQVLSRIRKDTDAGTYWEWANDRLSAWANGFRYIFIDGANTQRVLDLGAGGDTDININDDLLVLGSTGDVAIGHTSPTNRLDISDSGYQIKLRNPNAGGEDYFIGTSSNNWGLGGGKFGISLDGSSAGTALVIDNNKRIGIGNSSPDAMLAINSTLSEDPLRVRIDGDTKFRVYADGRVYSRYQLLVGTSSPASGYMASINGKVICEELRVKDSGSWPDYVFKSNYNLKSIEEVKEYINDHGHLPNIPSAKVVEAEGIAVGDMQKKMMEKIEELTLYVIQLKEANDLMKTEIENLKNSTHE